MNKEKIETRLSEHALTILVVMLVVAVGVSVVAGGAYVLNFYGRSVSEATGAWGEFGDYFGGILNPVFGFLSVMALLVTLVLQNRELRLSTEELRNSSDALRGQNRAIEHQSFEQTFFAWLNNYHELLTTVAQHTLSEASGITGRQALFAWWGPQVSGSVPLSLVAKRLEAQFGKHSMDIWFTRHPGTQVEQQKAAMAEVSDVLTSEALQAWGSVYLKHEYQLDSLFRNLYRLLLWIDSHHERQLSQAQKWLYISIVRGQLSWIEQVFLFYNGLTERGRKFRILANKYALFDNLTTQNDPILEHVVQTPPPNTAYEDRAYNSVLARRALGLPDTVEEVLAAAAADSAYGAARSAKAHEH